MLKAAQLYIQLDLPIIPLCSGDHSGMSTGHIVACRSPGKRPLIRDWQNAKVPTEQEVREWFRRWPTANIGLLLGQTSGLVGLDVDGTFGHEMLQKLNDGQLPASWQFSTPGGGMRYLFAAPPGRDCPSRHIRDPDQSKQHSELAILGDGKCTVLPPSKHANGGTYTWINPPTSPN